MCVGGEVWELDVHGVRGKLAAAQLGSVVGINFALGQKGAGSWVWVWSLQVGKSEDRGPGPGHKGSY